MPAIGFDSIKSQTIFFTINNFSFLLTTHSYQHLASIPYPLIIPVSKTDEKRAKESEGLWDTQVRLALESQVTIPDIKMLTQALYDRIEEAGRMLPLPEEDVATVQESSNHQESDVLENFTTRVYQTPGLQG
jgi:type IV secretion system protein VirD4